MVPTRHGPRTVLLKQYGRKKYGHGKGNITAQRQRAKNRNISRYDRHVNNLIEINTRKQNQVGYTLNGRTDGERAVANALRGMKIRYVPEYVLDKLNGDINQFRVADFYLPRENVYVEHLGNWNSIEDHQQRYKQKMAVYGKNNIKCIYIFPDQLNNISWELKKQLQQIKNGTHPYIGGNFSSKIRNKAFQQQKDSSISEEDDTGKWIELKCPPESNVELYTSTNSLWEKFKSVFRV